MKENIAAYLEFRFERLKLLKRSDKCEGARNFITDVRRA